ncbi:helix-turn-helix domain-containing protein [Ornithinimicrobium sp. W1665]|uniref:helix-turn-helix domain-containing protein n=1 Tax=Ornithinimicrobium sp. W1665 TaxID=3416666 RepID=UPI003CF7CF46
MVLLRREMGDVLRERRQGQGRTLREVSAEASCSLGYLSEIERGEKEASSELLASICRALDLPLSQMLSDVADRVSLVEAADTQMTALLTDGLARPLAQGQVRRRGDQVVSAA